MTKEEYLKGIIPHDEWLKGHAKYVKNALIEMRKCFYVDRFINDYLEKADRNITECILADAFMNNNMELGELEDYIARLLCVPYEDIVEYRTEEFWDEIREV